MSTGAKIFLVVLVLLALLFAVGIGMSIHHKTDTTSNTRDSFKASDHPVLESVQRSFSLSSPPVKPVGAGCLGYAAKRLRIAGSSACGLRVPPAGNILGVIPPADYRQVAFKVTLGKVSFTPEPGDKVNKGKSGEGHDWSANEADNNEGKLSVSRDGGTLLLRCQAAGGCEIQIE